MSELHELCRFPVRPIVHEQYVVALNGLLSSGIPATYTLEEANRVLEVEGSDDVDSTTTPLHILVSNIPLDYTPEEATVVEQMISTLFEYGAGWCLVDANSMTPGCILLERKLTHTPFYQQILDAGVRAELLLRKVSEYDMEIIDEDELDGEVREQLEHTGEAGEPEQSEEPEEQPQQMVQEEDPSENQSAYLKTKLEYKDDALVTKDRGDGVMMAWEDNLMELGCESLFKNAEKDEQNVLNIGFGMGIIDTMIQAKGPTKHYICEAHPDVLAKLDQDGWFDKANVVILPGRWQDQLPELLSNGVFFDGIYYDTYSEHYADMLDLFDFVVGLLKPTGIFSFFNGLGADRQFIYEVYKKLVEIDLNNYGLEVSFTAVAAPIEDGKQGDKDVWKGIKRPYWTCPVYYHPEATFM